MKDHKGVIWYHKSTDALVSSQTFNRLSAMITHGKKIFAGIIFIIGAWKKERKKERAFYMCTLCSCSSITNK